MAESNPTPWRCKHCHERVDPTMALCWNCGHDREGVAQPAMFVEGVDVDMSHCATCHYDLKGNADATACPECGEPVPWADCETCSARTSRSAMADGCPACRAQEAGVVFEREVALRRYTHCPACRYDLRGSPTATTCPECGVEIDRGAYETVTGPGLSQRETIETIRRNKCFWWSATGASFLAVLVLLFAGSVLSVNDWIVLARLAGLLLFVLVVWLVVCIIHLIANSIRSRD